MQSERCLKMQHVSFNRVVHVVRITAYTQALTIVYCAAKVHTKQRNISWRHRLCECAIHKEAIIIFNGQ